MKEKWDERYSQKEYIFGKEPNDFFKSQIDDLTPGRALFLGEGEGRNSVYAAKLGWSVDAYDISTEGMKKAQKLAEENNVTINYQIGDVLATKFTENHYDAVVLIYFHIENESREKFWEDILKSLKPNGALILLVYDKDNLTIGESGPSDINLLFALEDIAEPLIDLEFKLFSKELLSRTKMGKEQVSSVIKFVGLKRQQ